MKYLLLHRSHGINEQHLLFEGDPQHLQIFLDGHGCQSASHYRVLSAEECPIMVRQSTTLKFFVELE